MQHDETLPGTSRRTARAARGGQALHTKSLSELTVTGTFFSYCETFYL